MPGITDGISGPGQINSEWWEELNENAREVTEELQGGTIMQSFTIQGRADEAYRSSVLAQLTIGSTHPFYKWAHLVRRRFRTVIDKATDTKRRTVLTCLWSLRPCIHYPEITTTPSLVSQVSWWSYDDPPKMITPSPAGFPIPLPQIVVNARWPRAQITDEAMQWLDSKTGSVLMSPTTGEIMFMGYEQSMLLYEGISKKLLWGPFNQPESGNVSSVWDLTLHLRYDPFRKHKLWRAKFDNRRDEGGNIIGTGKPINPGSLANYLKGDGHELISIYRSSPFDLNSLSPAGADDCNPPPGADTSLFMGWP